MIHLFRAGLVGLILVRLVLFRSILRGGPPATRPYEGRRHGRYGVVVDRKTFEVRSVYVAMEVPRSTLFHICPERVAEKVAKRLGIASEIQTGDETFDNALYVITDDPAVKGCIGRSSQAREAIVRLTTIAHDKTLFCTRGQLWIEIPANVFASKVSSENAAEAAAALALADLDLIRNELQNVREAPQDVHELTRARLVLLSTLLGVGGIVAYLWDRVAPIGQQISHGPITAIASLMTLAVICSALVSTKRLFGASSFTHLLIVELLLVGAPGGWLISRSIVTSANQWFDASEARAYVTRREREPIPRMSGGSKGNLLDDLLDLFRTRQIVLREWPVDPDQPWRVPARLYRDARVGDCVQVTWREGAFHAPWIVRIRRSYANCDRR